jgi:hypothetical protein
MPPLMRSELPEVARTRHHWIVLFRLPHRIPALLLLGLLIWALIESSMWFVLVIVVLVAMVIRWQTWRAEQIILTRKRIIRVQGVPETTKSEAFLRVDRISGIRIVQSVPGKLLDYATIDLEAPGNHPDVRRLVKIWHPNEFYRELRHLIFSKDGPDPDDVGTAGPPPDDVTAPLPRLSPPQLRKR